MPSAKTTIPATRNKKSIDELKEKVFPTTSIFRLYGEMTEWPIVQHWKCCVPQGTEGSNPSLSAIF